MQFLPDSTRVISEPFILSGRTVALAERILAMSDADVTETMPSTEVLLANRHRDPHGVVERNFRGVEEHVENVGALSEMRRLVVGAYCAQEHSVDAAALTDNGNVISQNWPSRG